VLWTLTPPEGDLYHNSKEWQAVYLS
jgi:hypothetical protein